MPPGYTAGASGSSETREGERALWQSIRVSRKKVLGRCADYEGLEEWAREYLESRDPERQPMQAPAASASPSAKPVDAGEETDLEDVANEVGVNLFGIITIPSVGSFIKRFRRWKNQDDNQ